MARNPAAQTAFGPMVQAAIEQYEPPERRLVEDDLALSMLPPASGHSFTRCGGRCCGA
jgi:O-methyltransferase involved in polyketide biosynthesis